MKILINNIAQERIAIKSTTYINKNRMGLIINFEHRSNLCLREILCKDEGVFVQLTNCTAKPSNWLGHQMWIIQFSATSFLNYSWMLHFVILVRLFCFIFRWWQYCISYNLAREAPSRRTIWEKFKSVRFFASFMDQLIVVKAP